MMLSGTGKTQKTGLDYRDPRQRAYIDQRGHAAQRGIAWELTFTQWWDLWEDKWEQRGRKKGEYQMCRTGDTGPYAVGNVRIDTSDSNKSEAKRKPVYAEGVLYPSVQTAAEALGYKNGKMIRKRIKETRKGYSYGLVN